MNLLFLDIDGVLNNHSQYHGFCHIDFRQANYLDNLINHYNCKICLVSAWRYMILRGDMTVKGFEYLLISHRINAKDRIIDLLEEDNEPCDRGKAIWPIIKKHSPKKYVILDDLDIGYTEAGHKDRFVQPDSKVGLDTSTYWKAWYKFQ